MPVVVNVFSDKGITDVEFNLDNRTAVVKVASVLLSVIIGKKIMINSMCSKLRKSNAK